MTSFAIHSLLKDIEVLFNTIEELEEVLEINESNHTHFKENENHNSEMTDMILSFISLGLF